MRPDREHPPGPAGPAGADPGTTSAEGPAGAWRVLWRRLVAWLLSHWPGRVVVRSARAFKRVELFDRSMTVAAQFFTCIFPILILLATVVTRRDSDRLAELVSLPEESREVLEDAVTAADSATFGVLGIVVVLVTATGVSRALSRAFAAIWELPRPRASLRSVWRWIGVVLALSFSLVTVRSVGRLVSGVPPEVVWPATAMMLCDLALALFVPWLLLSGAVRARLLLPGALVLAVLMLPVRPVMTAWLPQALESSADRYGSIGVTFTYLALLYGVSFTLLATAVVGQVVATDEGRLGRWIRADDADVAAATRRPGAGTAPGQESAASG